MDTPTFETLVKSGAVTGVTLVRPAAEANWEIHVRGKGLPKALKKVVELNGGGGTRSWTDLDAAHSYLRKHGYTGRRIELDEDLGNAD
jgi:hypothetical protein